MTTRLILTLLISALGIRVIFAATPQGQRSGDELCAELTAEVNLSVEQGLLTRDEASTISRRCYFLYGGKPNV